MAHKRTTRIILSISILVSGVGISAVASEAFAMTPLERTLATPADESTPRSSEQQALVDSSLGRFDSHNLDLPEIQIQFHDSLETCGWHKGLYIEGTKSLHMCSVDESTMLHEMAHAWANLNLTSDLKRAFVDWRGLQDWNDHDQAWEDRATEHVAETIAWALASEPTDVRWVETQDDGSQEVTYRLLSIGVDVETLTENFIWLTGQSSNLRSVETGR